jgi:Fe-S cluster assembly protein SufD
MNEDEATALLTEAFIGEVVDRIVHEGAREVVRAWVADRLRV